MKFKLKINTITLEATSLEDALRTVGARFSAIARHVGNGEPLESSQPFFTLVDAADDAPAVDITVDPIVVSRQEQERLEREKAEAEAAAAEAEKAGKETQTVDAADVGDVKEVLGDTPA